MATFYCFRLASTMLLIAEVHCKIAKPDLGNALHENDAIFGVASAPAKVNHMQTGLTYHQKGMFSQAAESYKKHLAQDNNSADAWHLLGLATQQQSNARERKLDAEKYIEKVNAWNFMENLCFVPLIVHICF